MKQNNILIMAWGKTINGYTYKRQKVKFPTECPILLNFDINKNVGIASNFKNISKGITCDVEYAKKITDTIAPTFKGIMEKNREIKDLELINLSFIIAIHSMMKCNYNLKEKQ